MKESYRSRSSDQSGPESCVEVPQGAWRSVDRGKCGLSIELRNTPKPGMPTSSCVAEGNSRHADSTRGMRTLRSRRPQARMDTLCAETGRALPWPWGWTPGSVRKTHGVMPRMYGVGQSDECVVPKKSPNKGRGAPWFAEVMEERRSTKGNSSAAATSVLRGGTTLKPVAGECDGRITFSSPAGPTPVRSTRGRSPVR